VGILSSESFADSSHAGTDERHVLYALCTQPHASRWICRSVRQQRLQLVFN